MARFAVWVPLCRNNSSGHSVNQQPRFALAAALGTVILLIALGFLSPGSALAQAAATAGVVSLMLPSAASPPAVSQTPDHAQIDATLKAYVDAYGRRNMDDLVAVWPDLVNQKKEYKKIKDFFEDHEISDEKVTLDSCEAQIRKNDAITKCERTEKFIRTYTETQWLGDAMMASPAQRPPPWQVERKSPVKKSKEAWVRLHKNGSNWQIVSVS